MRDINLIVIHCSASADGRSLSKFNGTGWKSSAEVIDEWHKDRGFRRQEGSIQEWQPHLPHIGYHFVIDVDGSVECGRNLDEIGAHVQGFNMESVGICMVGTARFTRVQWKALHRLLCGEWSFPGYEDACLTKILKIEAVSPKRIEQDGRTIVQGGICGHRDLSPDQDRDGVVEPFEWLKTCPGFDVEAWMENGFLPPVDAVMNLTGVK